MRPPSEPQLSASGSHGEPTWSSRAARLYEELRRPAMAMVRRAFHGAFSPDEIDDVYSSAWVGTLRALERRHADLADDEIRRYVMTAVAHQASKELRRRSRRPTTPLEKAELIADSGDTPEERSAVLEESRITRDLLASLPPRRRAVMLLRYGWGLEPAQVCALVSGLSPRAYRKEITRGVDELTEKLRTFQRGEWCTEREPLLKAYAAGLADADEQRQARQHLSHCRSCAAFVGQLTTYLHSLGSALALPVAAGAVHADVATPGRVADLVDRARESATGMLTRGGAEAGADSAVSAATGAGSGSAGAAGAGVVAKLAGLGAAGKAALACLGGGAAATACIAAGVAPSGLGDAFTEHDPPQSTSPAHNAPASPAVHEHPPESSGYGTPPEIPPPTAPPADSDGEPAPPPTDEQPEPAPPPPPPAEQQFGLAPAPAPAPQASETSSSASGGGSTGSGVAEQFGP